MKRFNFCLKIEEIYAEKEENLYKKHRNINRTKTYYDWNTCWSDAPIQDGTGEH